MSARADHSSALTAVAGRLRCPHCGASLSRRERALVCAQGHSYDVARQGHVTLQAPGRRPAPGDSATMVAAREAFVRAGHYAPIAGAVAAAAADSVSPDGAEGGCVIDLGAGTGYYLAGVLAELAGWSGLALDISRPALRRAVRAHPGIAAVACDLWQPLPLRDGTAELVLNVFAPHNAPETARILTADGRLILVTPLHEHLRQLVTTLGMIGVDRDKEDRLQFKLSPHLRAVERRQCEFDMTLRHLDIEALVAMGPSAHHLSPEGVRENLAPLSEPVAVTASVAIETWCLRRGH